MGFIDSCYYYGLSEEDLRLLEQDSDGYYNDIVTLFRNSNNKDIIGNVTYYFIAFDQFNPNLFIDAALEDPTGPAASLSTFVYYSRQGFVFMGYNS